MPIFVYTAKSEPNKTVQGNIEAQTKQEATDKITKLGYFPVLVEIEDLSLDKNVFRRFWRFSRKEIVHLTNHLSILIESGIDIVDSLNILIRQSSNKYIKSMLENVVKKIKDGMSLSESFSSYPQVFSSLYVAMIHAGEVGGNIDKTLKGLADFLEKEEEFKNSVRGALIYPFFILTLSAATVIVLIGFVIPRLSTMFEDMGQMLPLPTRILLDTSRYVVSYGWLMLSAAVVVLFLCRRVYLSEQGRTWFDRFQLKIPVLGEVVLKTEISHLFRTLSLLLSSGISIMSALGVCIAVVDNKVLKIEVQRIKEKISGGSTFSKTLAESRSFPPLVINVVSVGEETGTIEKSLVRIADEYEKDVDKSLKTLIRLLEPIIILVMGLIVGFIVLSMLLPIFQFNFMAAQ